MHQRRTEQGPLMVRSTPNYPYAVAAISLIIVILEMVSYQNKEEVTESRPLGEPRRLGIGRNSISL